MSEQKKVGEIVIALKEMIHERLMLPMSVEEIDEEMLLFESEDFDDDIETIGLDSVDGLEIMAGIYSMYGVKMDAQNHKAAYKNILSLATKINELTAQGEING